MQAKLGAAQGLVSKWSGKMLPSALLHLLNLRLVSNISLVTIYTLIDRFYLNFT